MEYITIEPANKEKATHTCIILHGLGANGNDLQGLTSQIKIKDGINMRFIFPHAPIIPMKVNRGLPCNSWFDYESKDGDINTEQLLKSLNSVLEIVDKQKYDSIDSSNVIVGGFSQGASLALNIGLLSDVKLLGVFSMAGFLLSFSTSVQENDINKDTPFWLAHGNDDDVVESDYSKRAAAYLTKKTGYADVGESYYDNLSHSISIEEIKDLSDWINKITN
jgi:phospholipase/carboxylesterase